MNNVQEFESYYVKERGAYYYKDKNILPLTDDSVSENWLFCDGTGWITVENNVITGFQPIYYEESICECGATSVGSGKHISYCPLYA